MENTLQLDDSLIKEYLEYLKIDELGLWIIISDVREKLNLKDPTTIQAAVINTAQKLLAYKTVAAISYHPEKEAFEVWGTEPSSVIARLKEEWAKLGRIPDLRDGIYFVDKEQLPLLKTIPSP